MYGSTGASSNGKAVSDAEVEILFLPGDGQFSHRADFQILVLLDDAPITRRAAATAHRIIANRPILDRPIDIQFPMVELSRALDSIV